MLLFCQSVIKLPQLVDAGSAVMYRQGHPYDIAIGRCGLVPQTGVDNRDDPCVAKSTDQTSDPLLQFDDHLRHPDFHELIFRQGCLILNDGVRYGEGETKDHQVGQAFSSYIDPLPVCAGTQQNRVFIFPKLLQHLVLGRAGLLDQDLTREALSSAGWRRPPPNPF